MFKFIRKISLHDIWQLFRDNKPDEALVNASTEVVNIVQSVKLWVDKPETGEFFASVLGDEQFQKDRAIVEAALEAAVKDLTLVKDMKDLPTFLEGLPVFHKKKFWHDLALTLTNVLTNGKFGFGDIVLVVQTIFRQLFGKK